MRGCSVWARTVSFRRTAIGLAAIVAAAFATSISVQAERTERQVRAPLILVPGLMGSRLCRDDPAHPSEPRVVWGTLAALLEFPNIRLPKSGEDDIRPCGLVREIAVLGPIKQHYYGPVVAHLEQLGYREGADLHVFDYDWRRSVFDNAQALDAFVRTRVGEGQVDILAHSMGALVARVYTIRYGQERVARLISAGAPFLGAAKVLQTVEKGWGPLNLAMGGLSGFRRTMLSFPSIFEVMARYEGCCQNGTQAFAPQRAETWSAIGWDGVDPATMPDLAVTFGRIRELEKIVSTGLPAGVEEVMLIGVDQRTAQRVHFETAASGTVLRVQTSWAGDGTVLRDSAVLQRTDFHPTSFAVHERILLDPQIREFLDVALSRGISLALKSVPVRPRGRVLGANGEITELVGVALESAEPVYRTGDSALTHVHVRLGSVVRLPSDSVKLFHTDTDGREREVPLTPDPDAADRSNPFEQSFTGRVAIGSAPGLAMLRAVVALEGAPPRRVEEPLLVLTR